MKELALQNPEVKKTSKRINSPQLPAEGVSGMHPSEIVMITANKKKFLKGFLLGKKVIKRRPKILAKKVMPSASPDLNLNYRENPLAHATPPPHFS